MAMNPYISRRQFLAYGAAGTAGLLLLPSLVQARAMDTATIMNLHPVRFIAGLLLNFAKAVLVDLAKDALVQALHDGVKLPANPTALSSCVVACDDSQFRHANYKASVVVLGVADYRAHQQRQLELLLKDDAQFARFTDTLQYLRDEKLRVRLAGMEYAQVVGKDTIPDDLFTLDRHGITPYRAEHVQELSALTGTTAFENWGA